MDGLVDDRGARAEVTRPFRSLEDDKETTVAEKHCKPFQRKLSVWRQAT